MGQRGSVERSSATVAEEHEIARVESVLNRDAPDRSSHDHCRDGDHSIGHSDHAVAASVTERLRDPLLDGALGRVHVELHFTAEKVFCIETPED